MDQNHKGAYDNYTKWDIELFEKSSKSSFSTPHRSNANAGTDLADTDNNLDGRSDDGIDPTDPFANDEDFS